MSALLRDHYRTLVDERGFERPAGAVGDLPAVDVERRFAAADRGRAFAARVADGAPALVTTGISMTGPPHVGTLGQLRTAIAFQDAGIDVQLVVADLPAYLAAGRDLDAVGQLAGRYRSFARELGFDDRAGVLRTQLDAPGVLRTAMLLSRYYDPDGEEDEGGDPDDGDGAPGGDDGTDPGPTAFERELAAAYESAATVGVETPSFAGAQTGLLLVADTLHPLIDGGYEHVCFVGGADNHRLSAAVRTVLDRSPYAGSVSGLYTRLVPGLEGYPKMSKRLPGSGISLDDDPDAVREQVMAADEGGGEAVLREMMRIAAPGDGGAVAAWPADPDGDDWADATREYAAFLADAAETWGRTTA